MTGRHQPTEGADSPSGLGVLDRSACGVPGCVESAVADVEVTDRGSEEPTVDKGLCSRHRDQLIAILNMRG